MKKGLRHPWLTVDGEYNITREIDLMKKGLRLAISFPLSHGDIPREIDLMKKGLRPRLQPVQQKSFDAREIDLMKKGLRHLDAARWILRSSAREIDLMKKGLRLLMDCGGIPGYSREIDLMEKGLRCSRQRIAGIDCKQPATEGAGFIVKRRHGCPYPRSQHQAYLRPPSTAEPSCRSGQGFDLRSSRCAPGDHSVGTLNDASSASTTIHNTSRSGWCRLG